jgi:ABC-2 type transport system permease protein
MHKRSSLFELTKGRWREFRREPSAFFFVIFMPILWMVILGLAFSGKDTLKVHVGWINGQPETVANYQFDIPGSLSSNKAINLHRGDKTEIKLKHLRGDISAIVLADETGLKVSFDSASQEGANASSIINSTLQEAAGRTDPLAIGTEKITLPGTRYIDFLIPGLLALSVMTSSLFGTGMLIVSNRRENLLKRYLATPMKPHEYLLSHIFGRTFIFIVEVSAILIAGYLIFGFKSIGSHFALLVFAFLGTAAFTSLAILCAARTANPAVMNGMTNVISLPMMLVAGVWFSRANFPEWLGQIVQYLPLTALVDGLRKITLEGASLSSLAIESAILFTYTLISTIATTKLFKWYS